jgi:flagellar motor switch protein FliM
VVDAEARLIGPRLMVRDLLSLEVGDCLEFDYPTDRRLDCMLNGTPKFGGQVMESRNKRLFAVENRAAKSPGD